MGHRHRSYGNFRGRVRLRRSEPGDTSLVISELRLNDTGRYRCEVIDGLEDQSVMVELELQGERVSVCEGLFCFCILTFAAVQPTVTREQCFAPGPWLCLSSKQGLHTSKCVFEKCVYVLTLLEVQS